MTSDTVHSPDDTIFIEEIMEALNEIDVEELRKLATAFGEEGKAA